MSDYSSNFPQQRPTFAFDAKAGKLDSRLSYTRSSTGAYLSSEKALSSENLLTYSNPNDAAWSENGSSVTTDQTTSPDGTSNASALTEDSSTGVHRAFLSTPVNSGDDLTIVAYLKANGRSIVRLEQTGVYTTSCVVECELSGSGTATTKAGSPTNVSIAQVGSTGWYKVSYSSSTTSSGTHYTQLRLCDAANSTSYTGDGTSGIYAYGLNLSNTGQLVTDSTSGQRHREYSPLLKTASADAPRFEYDASGNSEGLLIEAQATNLQRYGSDFASWSDKSSTTVTSNAAIAPNGLLESDLAVATSANIYHYVFDSGATIANATTYTGSCYVKKAGQRYIQITGGTTTFGSAQYATFDLDDGSIDVNGGVTASAVSVGNGWYRIQATMTSTASGSGGMAVAFANSATASRLTSFSGNDFDGVLVWGFQLETGSSVSSLVDTGTGSSQLSRAADSCSLVSAPLLDNGSGGLTVEYDMQLANETSYVLQTARSSGATNNDGVTVYNGGMLVNGSGTNTRLSNTTSNVFHKVAASWESGSQKISRDGSSVTEDTTTVVPQSGTDKLHIGTRQDGGEPVNGHIRNIAIYSEPLSSTNLTTLSQL